MDFNPLDLLAAAALSDKGSSENTETSPKQSAADKESNSEGADSKDDKDNQPESMGKTKSTGLSQPVKINSSVKVSSEMSPQKISWSPESFLSCLDNTSIDHENLIIEELSPTFIKEKINRVQMCNDDDRKSEEFLDSKNVGIEWDSIRNGRNISVNKNVKTESHSPSQDVRSSCEDVQRDNSDSVDVKDIKQEIDEPLDHEYGEGHVSEEVKDVKQEAFENGGQSDTDTAETLDGKSAGDEIPEMSSQELVCLDHSYCLIPGQLCRISSSTDMLDEDIDVCSDNSPLTEDSEQRSRNFSLDCNYLKSGILEGKSASTPQLHQYLGDSNCKLGSPSKSLTGFHSTRRLLKSGDTSAFKQVSVLSPERPAPSYGKFKIGTFASFSSTSNLELEKYLRGFDSTSDKKMDSSSNDNDRSNKVLHSPLYSSSVQPLLQSPTLDWDRSEAGSETQDDSSDARTPHRLSPDITVEKVNEWTHPMYHDHDYCAKLQQPVPVPDDVKLPVVKRKYTKRKNRLDTVDREKIMKAKYLKKELLKDSFLKSTANPLPETPPSVSESGTKSNPVGRPRKRPIEKTFEEEIDPETGAKMKITGKFQDQYVYYLSKSRTTSRRRQTPTLPLFSDKIIVPAPKPGDIIVPHLTDADIEVVRTKGRSALNLPERPNMPSMSAPPKSLNPAPLPSTHTNELISDEDSHIVSTILSMENDNLASPSSSQSHDLSQNSDLYNGQASINDGDPNMTSDQVLNYLLSCVKEEEPSLLHSSASLFPPIPSESLYSKSEHLSDPEIGNDNPLSKLGEVSSELPVSNSPLATNSLENSIIKSEGEDGNSLPDDLSSFISPSQVTTSSSTTQECDSQSSVKSEFSSEFSPLGTPNLSAPRLTSIEKTLDYLGVKDGELKLEQSDLFTSDLNPVETPSQPAIVNSVISSDDTPWIVTVTLYFNDVPAIMIVNEPYIRLVDIHKQILPAKDTGILKKRCQLLNIPVLNCTEMHRYFLVQYGKAYNSKSTLIISKDQATALVGYYANPQPRMGRADDSGIRRFSCNDGSRMSPLPMDTMTGPVKKRVCSKNNKKASQITGLIPPDVGVSDVKVVDDDSSQATDGLNKRTRHKKVNYLEMLRGEEKEKPTDSIQETVQSAVNLAAEPPVSSKISKEKCPLNSKSLSKKKIARNHSCGKKTKEHSNHKKKPVEYKKRVKDSNKLLKSSKSKGSSSKLGKKQEKLLKNEDEDLPQISLECGESSLNKSNKFKPLKLKVNSLLNFTSQRRQSSSSSLSSSPNKKGLFSRSNSSTSSAPGERPLRVLAVAHQAALSSEDGDSHLPSQPADIHLDLFTKSSSACVRCHTCSQFLSVPHFMKHHHVPMDNEWLATEAAHRILVPRNKENISDEERKLWEEFHRLQEAIGGFGEADDDSDSDGVADEDSDFDGNEDHSSLENSGASYLSLDLSFPSQSQPPQSSRMNSAICTDDQLSLHPKSVKIVSTHQNVGRNFSKVKQSEIIVKGDANTLPPISSSSVLSHHQESASHVRTSSRRRKSKQLFSIENYCTPTRKSTEDESSSLFSSVSGAGGI